MGIRIKYHKMETQSVLYANSNRPLKNVPAPLEIFSFASSSFFHSISNGACSKFLQGQNGLTLALELKACPCKSSNQNLTSIVCFVKEKYLSWGKKQKKCKFF